MSLVIVQALLENLLEATRASRVTLRLDVEGLNFPVVGEALAPGTRSIGNDHTLDQRGAPTAQWIVRHRRVLVQTDLTADLDPKPPDALLALYGVKAQILCPVIHRHRVIGWISVHAGEPRDWTEDSVAKVERVARQISLRLREIREPIEAEHGPLRT
jgi:GAF domain-containing protein